MALFVDLASSRTFINAIKMKKIASFVPKKPDNRKKCSSNKTQPLSQYYDELRGENYVTLMRSYADVELGLFFL